MDEERMRRDRILIIVSVVLSLLLVGSCFAIPYLLSTNDSSPSRDEEKPRNAAEKEEIDELEEILTGSTSYMDAQEIVEANYVEEVDEDDLLYAGARGISRMAAEGADEEVLVDRGITAMVDSLDDPHSSYMSAEELMSLDTQLSGRLTGIGVVMQMEKNEIKIMRVLDGTPALEVGLKDGDIIKEVDGLNIVGMDINEVVMLIRGEVGTTVRLGVVRPPSSDIKDFDIVRREIEIPVLETEMREGGVGYVSHTSHSWRYRAGGEVRGF